MAILRDPDGHSTKSGVILLVLSLVVLGGANLDVAYAQTEKTVRQENVRGNSEQKPYITREEFQSIAVRSPKGEVLLKRLLTISSVEEVTRLLGGPKKIERNDFSDTNSFDGWVHYERGTTLEYYGFPNGTSRLTTMELRSSGWSLTVGKTKLSPGVEVAKLSSTVQKSIQPGSSLKTSGIDGTGTIYIAGPSTKKEAPELPEGVKSHISIHLNRTEGVIRVVRLSRIPSN